MEKGNKKIQINRFDVSIYLLRNALNLQIQKKKGNRKHDKFIKIVTSQYT